MWQFEAPMDAARDLPDRSAGTRKLLLPIAIACLVVGLLVLLLWPAIDAAWLPGMSPQKYNPVFHAAIAGADRVVIRDGGMDCCGAVDGQAILYEIKDPAQVRDFRDHIQIAPRRWTAPCRCCGYPGIDWYAGDRRLALTAITTIPCLRWVGFRGDVFLTEDSYRWLDNWMQEHQIPRSTSERMERREAERSHR
jgi:hypothetical protein